MAVDLQLPPGFRFHPTDDELVMHYLCRKCSSQPISVPIIADIDLYKYDPWQLPGMAFYGEKEWFFFSPRERKYPNGSRPNRTAGSGYWKATGADKPIGGTTKPVGIKKALVFYTGKAPKGEKTNWIMHEYRLADVDRSVRMQNRLRLDDWVLCRIYNKKGSVDEPVNNERKWVSKISPETLDRKPEIPTIFPTSATTATDLIQLDSSDSMPRFNTDSSCSEHVLSPEFKSEREVQSEPKWKDWAKALGSPIDVDSFVNMSNPFTQFDSFQLQPGLRDSYHDMFLYLQKPF